MDALKKFIGKKKADIKFKTAGPGHKLTEDVDSAKQGKSGGAPGPPHHAPKSSAGPSEEKRQAAAAALARLEKQKKPEANEKERLAARQMAYVREQARREIEAEMKLKESGQVPDSSVQSRSQVDTSSVPAAERVVLPGQYAVDGIFYKCPIVGPEVSTKEDIETRIKEFLREQPEEELSMISCLMIHSCNKPREKVEVCVDILCRYLDNIITNPDNPKVRKIRFGNKAYQDKVNVIEGASQFLTAAGFEKTRMKNDDTGDDEDVWYFKPSDGDMKTAVAHLTELRDTLKQTTPIKPELDRNLQVLMPAQVKQRKELPPEFYQLTTEEIKREQRLKTELAERELTLRTKAQREMDEKNEQRVYRYCVMRVRFPDGFTLQGTFWAGEKIRDLYSFVKENLLVDDLDFTLKMPRGEGLQSVDSTLTENRLPPASVVNFHVDNPPPGIASGEVSYLKPEVLALVKSLE